MRHWRGLDGLRAVAVIAVIADHAYVFSGGYLGVDVFFVLSGFLITTLLIDEWDRRGGRISFSAFYARRVLRLFPALAVLLVVTAAIAGLLLAGNPTYDRPFAAATFDAIPAVALFAGNWVRAVDSSSVTGSLGLLGHTWSLAVEEQFYLIWPAVFAVLARRRIGRGGLAALLGLAAVADMAYRAVAHAHGYGNDRIYFGADTHCDGLLAGCALAFWLASAGPAGLGQLGRLPRLLLRRAAWPAAVVLAALLVFASWPGLALETSGAVLATALLVAAVAAGELPAPIGAMLGSELAVAIGRRSYGIYLWQYVLIALAQLLCAPYTGTFPVPAGPRRLVFSVALAAAAAAAFAAAQLSYRYVELPALRRKRRFGSAPDQDQPAVAGVGDVPAGQPG